MNELQKKVLLFLLNELKEQVREWSCDESEIPSLTDEDRLNLTMMLWSHWGELEEWDGNAEKDFGVSSLVNLAKYWLTGEK